MKRYWIAALLVLVTLSSPGCATLSYYAQSIQGQLSLIAQREPIKRVLDDPAVKAPLKQRLELSQRVRDFASTELALPDNESYRSYVALDRPYVLWAVFAAPALSLQPREWCFPIAGCVPYRGYFAQADAEGFADRVRAEGLDVYVGGVPAYSTLGWFDDPLISSMLGGGEARLAGVIFHELAHQRVYVPGDSTFNESFAVAVEKAGVTRWLAANDSPAAVAAYNRWWDRKNQFFDLIERTRRHLAEIYARDAPPRDKRTAKAAAFMTMRQEYRTLKARWGGYKGYDAWFETPINNARLAAVSVYRDYVPAFEGLLAACDDDFAAFYARVDALAALDPDKRAQALGGPLSCEVPEIAAEPRSPQSAFDKFKRDVLGDRQPRHSAP